MMAKCGGQVALELPIVKYPQRSADISSCLMFSPRIGWAIPLFRHVPLMIFADPLALLMPDPDHSLDEER